MFDLVIILILILIKMKSAGKGKQENVSLKELRSNPFPTSYYLQLTMNLVNSKKWCRERDAEK